jgi:hypothetical protein
MMALGAIMFVVPVPADEFLPFVIRAIESEGYAGLFIILARTADAREQHEELTRDWTSIHDVTGPLLAVLCPDPKALCSALVYDGHISTGIAAEGLYSGTWDFDPRDADAIEALVMEYSDRGGQATRPFSARAHQDAWSETTSRCARYFGIGEESLPSLLVLSYLERTATLISLASGTSIYALCKSVVARLGTRPDDLRHTRAAQHEATSRLVSLRQESDNWEIRQRKVMLPYAEWQEQLRSLDRHIAMLEKVLPDLTAQARSTLTRLMADEPISLELCDQLRALDTIMNAPDFNRTEIPSRRIHNRIWKVVQKLEAGPQARPLPERTNKHRPLVASAMADLERLNLLLEQRTSALRLSQTVWEAVRELYRVDGFRERKSLPHLQDWSLWTFRQRSRMDLPMRNPRV